MIPVDPIGQIDQGAVGINRDCADLDLARLGIPFDGAEVAEVETVVDRDLDVVTLPVIEPLDSGEEFAVVHRNVADVIGGLRQIRKGRLV